MDLGLRGRVALVTGASRGIGKAVSRSLGAEGVALAIVSNDAEEIQRVAVEIGSEFRVEVLPIHADLTRAEEVERFARTALSRFGRADILVNVAGNTPAGRLSELTDAQWAQAFDLKFYGAVRASRAVLPAMRQQRWGCIINVTGVAGWQPLPQQLTIGAVNAALLNFTKALSREAAAEGVRVNAVVPGPTQTDRFWQLVDHLAAERRVSRDDAKALMVAEIPDGRPGMPEEVAAAILFLASQPHINGVALEIDGGETRGLH